jgi:SPP1 family predicted phage head-tail adaptor
MDAGKLDRRVTLQRKGAEVDDGIQTVPGDWADLADVWAQFLPQSAAERAQAGETAAYNKIRIRIRKDSSWSDLNAKDGFYFTADPETEYNISGVTEPDRGWLVVEGVGRGDS